MRILVATQEEFDLANKYLTGYDVMKIGVGAGNVIRRCSGIRSDEKCINVGFAGSNTLPIGKVTKVSKTYRLRNENVEFEDYRNGYELSPVGYPCYTANDFVTSTDKLEPVLFDMELNYIAAFRFRLLGAVKIVSDNLMVDAYNESVNIDDHLIWEKVKALCDEISRTS